MKKLYRFQVDEKKYIAEKRSKEVTEKIIIMDFFKGLPIDSLKKLINFQEINFENKELWEDSENYELLHKLRDENKIRYTAELYLDFE